MGWYEWLSGTSPAPGPGGRDDIDIAPGVSLAQTEREWSRCRARGGGGFFPPRICQGHLDSRGHLICNQHGVDHGPYQGG